MPEKSVENDGPPDTGKNREKSRKSPFSCPETAKTGKIAEEKYHFVSNTV